MRLYGHYWGNHKTNLRTLPIYTEAEEADYTEIEEAEVPIENHEVTPPNPAQDTQQDLIIETQQNPKEPSEPCKIAPPKISFNQVVFKKIKRKLNHFIGNILARTEVYKKLVAKYDDLTGKYDDLTGKYESLLAKETNIKETFWERRADSEKEAFFLEHFYLTSVYVASTAGYYLTPKGAKTFIEATERFKIIEPVDMFMDNSAYHDIANFTYVPCPVSLSKHSLDSTIQKPQKKSLKSYPPPPKKSTFRGLFFYSLNAKKRLKAFHKYSKQYDHLKTPKEV